MAAGPAAHRLERPGLDRRATCSSTACCSYAFSVRGSRSRSTRGSGAGLPGLPIKIVRPGARVTLIESRERRVSFLSAVVRELALDRDPVVNVALRTSSAEISGTFGAVVARCAGGHRVVLFGPELAGASRRCRDRVGPPQEHPLKDGRWVTRCEGHAPGHVRRLWTVLPARRTRRSGLPPAGRRIRAAASPECPSRDTAPSCRVSCVSRGTCPDPPSDVERGTRLAGLRLGTLVVRYPGWPGASVPAWQPPSRGT